MKYWISFVLLITSLPAMSEIHTPHCLAGCPEGVDTSNDLIVRDIYTISSNDETKFTDWAAYTVTNESIGSGCSRKWKADPLLSNIETLSPSDYKGAHAQIGIDRGHQVPLASVCGSPRWKEANYLSNITPQKSELNQGPWKYLEEKVRNIVLKDKYKIYVLTGPLYEKDMPKLPNASKSHSIPSGYWKIVSTKEGDLIKSASFIMDQDSKRKDNFCDKKVSLQEVEKRSGLALFPSTKENVQINDSLFNTLCE
ncbi:DNA/RNA non-specific endonuclease [Vibrio cyclitrophicus]|uniref:DNA/RNA non-specific endonuclease n=1 Tax=Vibrio cyclitrophicus TaxID=47951 RepID=UPI00148BF402|nr:DNA/RNA non-specific endonuclease [Vibrio cyclitrophicus]NOH19467.1 DNA/RNA non-specific endonuclease [Vibrio cyclitrophicus]